MKIAEDKQKHFFVGSALALGFQALAFWWLPGHVALGALLVLGLIIAIGYGFELFSRITGYGHYEVMDAVAVLLGGLLGEALAFGGYYLLHWE